MENTHDEAVSPLLVIIGILIVLVVLAVFLMMTYNGLVTKDVNAENAWAKVQSAYQRRADLIPNFAETVKGAALFEKSTLTEIAEARSRAGQIQQEIRYAQTPQDLENAGNSMGSVLSRLMVVVENYPELKSNQNFLALQDELAGTENRIKYERDEYNNAVRDYRESVRTVPTVLVAGFLGFDADKWMPFEADAAAQHAPTLNFTGLGSSVGVIVESVPVAHRSHLRYVPGYFGTYIGSFVYRVD